MFKYRQSSDERGLAACMQGFGQAVPFRVEFQGFLGRGGLNRFSFVGGSANGTESQVKIWAWVWVWLE